MQPLTIINGILLGSSFAIMFGLAVVMLIFLILGSDYPRLEAELKPLLQSTALFTVLTAISAASFYTLIKKHPLRWPLQVAMWLFLLVVAAYFWPA